MGYPVNAPGQEYGSAASHEVTYSTSATRERAEAPTGASCCVVQNLTDQHGRITFNKVSPTEADNALDPSSTAGGGGSTLPGFDRFVVPAGETRTYPVKSTDLITIADYKPVANASGLVTFTFILPA